MGWMGGIPTGNGRAVGGCGTVWQSYNLAVGYGLVWAVRASQSELSCVFPLLPICPPAPRRQRSLTRFKPVTSSTFSTSSTQVTAQVPQVDVRWLHVQLLLEAAGL